MLTWLAAGLAAAALGVALRWLATRVDTLGRRRPFPLVSVLLLVALSAGAATPGLLRARLEQRLAGAASVLVGRQVTVRCQGLGGAWVDAGIEAGYVRYRPDGTPEQSTLIKREQCRHLAAYLRSDKRDPSLDQVVAVHVLAHESMHMAGLTDEARAECAAVQRDARLARLLDASAADARLLAGRYWRSVYPRMPGGYRSAACGPGGALDERLPDPPWSSGT